MDSKSILAILSSKYTCEEKKLFLELFITKIKSIIPTGVKGTFYRYQLVPNFGYCIPDYDSISEISYIIRENNIKSVLSIGAGVGFVEKTINIVIGNEIVTATDPQLSHQSDVNIVNKWMDIEKLKHTEALDKYNPDCVMMVWPSMEDWSYETVKLAGRQKINYIIYIGEINDCPCTGTTEMMDELETNWDNIKEIYYKNFQELNDYISVYRRKV